MVYTILHWANTVNLGAIIVSILVVSLFGLSSVADRGAKRWRDLYTLADTERKEVTEELHEANKHHAAQLAECNSTVTTQKETIAQLEALQMPLQVIEALQTNAQAAHDRQHEILSRLEQADKESAERHRGLMIVLELIAKRLGPEDDAAVLT